MIGLGCVFGRDWSWVLANGRRPRRRMSCEAAVVFGLDVVGGRNRVFPFVNYFLLRQNINGCCSFLHWSNRICV
ncbi:hypothetical protein RchiOBHm_Chr4g0421001 [Rosa chinensis]|uniref:Uncharacterized protein n=1 Tax=Rosa chinensis TaxID=74649 RepID=A0A2P6QY77_ROSCH|nr:hypothetical protein RchiOBHm_Chr4g0421001 [Rosa chinensis]